ncbi:uncharacterized protein LOC142590752 [Dermacentor variabilis]|uniref:uncharacterized protein LOC142590752 n=1 Tax=Dermacentor variabilis TaxID=34621 RepID=UPI003F5AEA29
MLPLQGALSLEGQDPSDHLGRSIDAEAPKDDIEARRNYYIYQIPANTTDTIYLVGFSSALNHSNIRCVRSEYRNRTGEIVRRMLSMDLYIKGCNGGRHHNGLWQQPGPRLRAEANAIHPYGGSSQRCPAISQSVRTSGLFKLRQQPGHRRGHRGPVDLRPRGDEDCVA